MDKHTGLKQDDYPPSLLEKMDIIEDVCEQLSADDATEQEKKQLALEALAVIRASKNQLLELVGQDGYKVVE